ncbi:MAG: diacylglycerol/lipid kinase family protein [Ignavibacteria bacterium]|jgi:diacylglycerol kinase (ATP)
MKMYLISHGRLRGNTLVEMLQQDYQADVHYTESTRHASELAARIPFDTTVLAVAGGDGTLHEVVDGLMQRKSELRPPILLLPLGSGNDTARMIGAKATIADIRRRLTEFNSLEWDILECTIGSDGQTRYCTNVLDVGFGGDVARRFNGVFRRLPPRLGYMAATLQAFVTASAHEITVSADDVEVTAPMLMVAVANSKWFGSGIGIAPYARPHDGIADLTLITNVGVLTYLRFLPQLIKGRVISDTRIQYLQSTRVVITASKPLPIEIDGEFVGNTPLHVVVRKNSVRLLI